MPWLMIHITMPLMLLAAIGLQPIVLKLKDALKRVRTPSGAKAQAKGPDLSGKQVGTRFIASVLGAIVAVFTLVLTLQNMFQVVYVHPAYAPHEMMIYVQTTPDVNNVIAKVDQFDRQLYGGWLLMRIAAMSNVTWTFSCCVQVSP